VQFWIAKDGTVAVSDALFSGIDVSALPTNVKMVFWNTDVQSGELLYSDRVLAREKFTDLSPYLPILNDWIRAASNQLAVATPKADIPLTITQAVTIKSSLVDGLFVSKRQAPIVLSGQTYDGSDAETAAMSNAVNASSPAAINLALAALTASVNTAASQAVTNVNTETALFNTDLHTDVTDVANVNSLAFGVSAAISFPIDIGLLATTQPSIAAASVPATITAPTVDGPTISWPNTSGAPQSLSFSQISALLKSLTDRRVTLQSRLVAHKTAIATLTTPAAVASYDITAGW
jgi:hypothetical protein